MAKNGAAALASVRAIPLSELALISGVIVPPDRNKKENENEWSDCKVDLHRKGRDGRRAGHYYADVSYEGHERNRGRPKNQFQI